MKGEFRLTAPAEDFIGLSDLSARLKEKNKYCSSRESNWIITPGDVIAGYDGKKFYLLDAEWVPRLEWESDSYIAACGISDTARYAACVTAYNNDPACSAESGVFVLFDTLAREAVAARRDIGIDPNGIREIFIDDQHRQIYFYSSGKYMEPDQVVKIRCGFDLKPDEKMLEEYKKLNQRKKK